MPQRGSRASNCDTGHIDWRCCFHLPQKQTCQALCQTLDTLGVIVGLQHQHDRINNRATSNFKDPESRSYGIPIAGSDSLAQARCSFRFARSHGARVLRAIGERTHLLRITELQQSTYDTDAVFGTQRVQPSAL